MVSTVRTSCRASSTAVSLRGCPCPIRYTLKTVTRTCFAFLLLCALAGISVADETSFRHIKVPDAKGRPINGMLTFSDKDKAVEIQPAKGSMTTIPYSQIDKFAYEYTRKHRVSEGTIATAPLVVGAAAMLTKSRRHWLEIDYREQDVPKAYILRMDKHNYLRILDAVKAHTGKDAEVLGNADKRR